MSFHLPFTFDRKTRNLIFAIKLVFLLLICCKLLVEAWPGRAGQVRAGRPGGFHNRYKLIRQFGEGQHSKGQPRTENRKPKTVNPKPKTMLAG